MMNRARMGATRLEPGNGRSGAARRSTRAAANWVRRPGAFRAPGPADGGRPRRTGQGRAVGHLGQRRGPRRLARFGLRSAMAVSSTQAKQRGPGGGRGGERGRVLRGHGVGPDPLGGLLQCQAELRGLGRRVGGVQSQGLPREVQAEFRAGLGGRHLARDRNLSGRVPRPEDDRLIERPGTLAVIRPGRVGQQAGGRLRLPRERPAGQPLDRGLRGGAHRWIWRRARPP